MSHRSWRDALLYLGGGGAALIALFPPIWAAISSFTPTERAGGALVLDRWTLANYADLLAQHDFWTCLLHSAVVSLGTTAASIFADFTDGAPECVDGPDRAGSQKGLELCESHLDWIEVGAIGRKEQEPGALGANGLLGRGALMSRQIVQDDDVAGLEGRDELRLDIGFEDAPVHRGVNDERGGQGVASQAGNEGLGLPMSERGFGKKPLALRAPAAQARHLGGRSSLVQEDQPVWLKPHDRLARRGPLLARLLDVGPIVLAGAQSFF